MTWTIEPFFLTSEISTITQQLVHKVSAYGQTVCLLFSRAEPEVNLLFRPFSFGFNIFFEST